VVDQADFLNLVVCGYTGLSPRELLATVQGIEAEFGRDRSRERSKGPRTLDIDVLLYGDDALEIPELTLPHPGMLERAFVLVPLLELEPGLVHPVSRRPFSESIAAVSGQGIYLHAGPPI
jgi:2-amino-4-hydroxy-6-hydroxymethyldihydropteridine diphosphokinase